MAIDPFFGSLLGAGSSILGGLFGSSAQDDANKFAEKQFEWQKELAHKGIQWKTQDALAAGIHPVYALGAPPFNAAPVSVGPVGNPLGEGLANAGQAISEGIRAKADMQSKLAHDMSLLQLENQSLQNDMLRTQIRKSNSPGSVGANPNAADAGGTRIPFTEITVPAVSGGPRGAQKIQDRYDQLMALLYGTGYWAEDVSRHFGPRVDRMFSTAGSDLLKALTGGPDAPFYPGP